MATAKHIQSYIQAALVLMIIVLVNVLSSFFYANLDITEDKRFTLSESTYKLVDKFTDTVTIKVYLEGDFPAEYRRLSNSVNDILDKLQAHSEMIQFNFINPLGDNPTEARKDSIEKAANLKSIPVSNNRPGSPIYYVYPQINLRYSGRVQNVDLLESGDLAENPANGSIQIRNMETVLSQLEYKIAYALRKLLRENRPKIAILTGHGEEAMFLGVDKYGRRIPNPYTFSFQQALFKHYDYEPLNLDSTGGVDQRINLLIIPKPRYPFGDKHLFMIDQYVMGGGKVLWLTEGVDMETDSLRKNGNHLLKDRPSDINNMLFAYGVRVNANLISSADCAALPLEAGGTGAKTNKPWIYFPLAKPYLPPEEAQQTGRSTVDHPIVKDIEYVELRYASSIDVVNSNDEKVKKTVLLRTNFRSRKQNPPSVVSIGMAGQEAIKPEGFQKGHQDVAVLLEGEFGSHYKNRIPPQMQNQWTSAGRPIISDSKATKMIVISDGDMIRNDFNPRSNQPPAPMGVGVHPKLGPYKFENETFLFNCIEYLLDDENIMASRSKEIKLRLLDQDAYKQETKYQLINMVLPLILLALFGLCFNLIRRRRFAN